MGIGHFHIADLDQFDLVNFNRQVGASMHTLGQPKVRVMEEMAAGINPSAKVTGFENGIQADNIEQFLDGVDVAVDGLDYFAVEARDLLYRTAYALNIPVVVAGPLGCSAALQVFIPGGMTWQEYFAMDLAKTPEEKYVLFAIGTAPPGLHYSYADATYVSIQEQYGPSLALAVQLCAGVVAAEVLKLLLKRGPLYPAPCYQQFDAYKCKYRKGKLRWGNRGPLQRLKFALLKRKVSAQLEAVKP
jgi:molybdopterin/thiamine biosynthesis adenylyltransferase